ncbi:MAG: hypothetical protein U1F68_07800 [Gammaproteobacteria bacterium]
MTRLLQRLLIVLPLAMTPLCTALAQAATPEQAAAIASQMTGGQVLSVKFNADPNRPGYQVKVLLPDGRVQIKFVPSL